MRRNIILFSVLFLVGTFIAVSTAADGVGISVERGKLLFNDPKLGTIGLSCNTCHGEGKGLESAFTKKQWLIDGNAYDTLEAAVNSCITMGLRGKPLNVKSGDIQSMIIYIKSLGIERNLMK
jgi:cytochrome c